MTVTRIRPLHPPFSRTPGPRDQTVLTPRPGGQRTVVENTRHLSTTRRLTRPSPTKRSTEDDALVKVPCHRHVQAPGSLS